MEEGKRSRALARRIWSADQLADAAEGRQNSSRLRMTSPSSFWIPASALENSVDVWTCSTELLRRALLSSNRWPTPLVPSYFLRQHFLLITLQHLHPIRTAHQLPLSLGRSCSHFRISSCTRVEEEMTLDELQYKSQHFFALSLPAHTSSHLSNLRRTLLNDKHVFFRTLLLSLGPTTLCTPIRDVKVLSLHPLRHAQVVEILPSPIAGST